SPPGCLTCTDSCHSFLNIFFEPRTWPVDCRPLARGDSPQNPVTYHLRQDLFQSVLMARSWVTWRVLQPPAAETPELSSPNGVIEPGDDAGDGAVVTLLVRQHGPDGLGWLLPARHGLVGVEILELLEQVQEPVVARFLSVFSDRLNDYLPAHLRLPVP